MLNPDGVWLRYPLQSVAELRQSLLSVNRVLQFLKRQLIVYYLVRFLYLLVRCYPLADQLQMIYQQSPNREHEDQSEQPHQHIHDEIAHHAVRVPADYHSICEAY